MQPRTLARLHTRKDRMNQPTTLPLRATPDVSAFSYTQRNEKYWKRNLFICVFGSFTTLVSLSMLCPSCRSM
jgi:DHA1 family multidrug resistance protein-like MFS transporter